METEENGIQEFTIYDWKVDAGWSIDNTGTLDQSKEWFGSRWHVGGKEYAGEFIVRVEDGFDNKTVFVEETNELPF